MSARVWVVGPIAWDTVIYLPAMPEVGKFVQAIQTIERPGGTAANAAIALATTGIETGFVGYLGDDHLSTKLRTTLEDSELKHLLSAPITEQEIVNQVLRELRQHPALEQSREQLLVIAKEARSLLGPLPLNDATAALFSLCDAVIDRSA